MNDAGVEGLSDDELGAEAPVQMTRRTYLMIRMMLDGTVDASVWVMREAVASVGLEHPEWDMDETATWAQWEAGAGGS